MLASSSQRVFDGTWERWVRPKMEHVTHTLTACWTDFAVAQIAFENFHLRGEGFHIRPLAGRKIIGRCGRCVQPNQMLGDVRAMKSGSPVIK